MRRYRFSAIAGFLFVVLAGPAMAQALLVDNFDYPAGDPLTDHGWTQIRSGTQVTVSDGGLEYPGYPLSGIGNAASLVSGNGAECKRAFATQSSGSVYVTFMVRPDEVTTVTNDGILTYLGPEDTTIFSRRLTVWVNKDDQGNVRYGISKAGGIRFTGYDYPLGVTTLLVIRYQFLPDVGDDSISLWINPDLEQPEPVPDEVIDSGDDASSIAEIVLTQLDAETPTAWVDGLHVGTAWGVSILPNLVFSDGFESD
jgi:hypothetical protein